MIPISVIHTSLVPTMVLRKFSATYLFSAFMVVCILAATQYASAQTSLTIGAGLSIPNDQINNVYNNAKLVDNSNKAWDMVAQTANLGYDLGLKARFPLSTNMQFSGGIGFSRFPQSDIEVKDPNTGQTIEILKSTQSIIPISAGLDYFLMKTVISPYVSAELQYNYIMNTVDYPLGGPITLPLNYDTAPKDRRIGAAVGAGLMIDLAVTALNVDLRYHVANMIGTNTDEKTKSYLTLNVGLTFGWKE